MIGEPTLFVGSFFPQQVEVGFSWILVKAEASLALRELK